MILVEMIAWFKEHLRDWVVMNCMLLIHFMLDARLFASALLLVQFPQGTSLSWIYALDLFYVRWRFICQCPFSWFNSHDVFLFVPLLLVHAHELFLVPELWKVKQKSQRFLSLSGADFFLCCWTSRNYILLVVSLLFSNAVAVLIVLAHFFLVAASAFLGYVFGYWLFLQSEVIFCSRAFQRFAVKTDRTLKGLSSKGSILNHCSA